VSEQRTCKGEDCDVVLSSSSHPNQRFCADCALRRQRNRQREYVRRRLQDPAYRESDRARTRKRRRDPNSREQDLKRRRERERQRYATDPEFRERKLERSRQRYANPEVRERNRQQKRERWRAQPEVRERHIEQKRNRRREESDARRAALTSPDITEVARRLDAIEQPARPPIPRMTPLGEREVGRVLCEILAKRYPGTRWTAERVKSDDDDRGES
jgi:hypothetical protein